MFQYKTLFPFLRWWPRVNKLSLRQDFIAGLTGAVLVVPQGVAFATIAGMPPQYGLYAGMIPAIIAALFGSSWHLVSGPTTAASIVLYSALSEFAEPGTAMYVQLALTLTFMVGITQFVMGAVRLGTVANFVSHSVIVGFTAAAAILIASKQISSYFGIHVQNAEHFYHYYIYLFQHIDKINWFDTLIATSTLFAGLLTKKFFPRIPYLMSALLVGALVAFFLRTFWQNAGGQVHMVGALPASLPPLSSPSFDFKAIRDLAPAALVMTLFALTEALSIARALSLRSGQAIEGNQEFLGQGLSNIVGSFFSGYVATGSFNRSGVNYDAGAQTPLAAVFAGVLLIIVVLLIAPFAAYLPVATMGGLLMLVAWRLIDFHHISKILRASREEAAILATTFFSALFLSLEFAILLGVLLSLITYLKRTSRPRIVTRVPNPNSKLREFVTSVQLPECPQLKIIRIDGSLYFGAESHVRELLRRMREHYPEKRHLLIIGNSINSIDISGFELLQQEMEIRRAVGGNLYLCGVKDTAIGTHYRKTYSELLGPEHLFTSKKEAIEKIFENLNRKICSTCEYRIFKECATIPEPESTK